MKLITCKKHILLFLAVAAGSFFTAAHPICAQTTGMVLIPAGAFTIGNSIGDADITDATPLSVTVSAFLMDSNLVSWSQWQSVYSWATNHGYGLDAGAGRAANHPVQMVNWYDVVKWCNARSVPNRNFPRRDCSSWPSLD